MQLEICSNEFERVIVAVLQLVVVRKIIIIAKIFPLDKFLLKLCLKFLAFEDAKQVRVFNGRTVFHAALEDAKRLRYIIHCRRISKQIFTSVQLPLILKKSSKLLETDLPLQKNVESVLQNIVFAD